MYLVFVGHTKPNVHEKGSVTLARKVTGSLLQAERQQMAKIPGMIHPHEENMGE